MDMLIIGLFMVVGQVYGQAPPLLPLHGSIVLTPDNATFPDSCTSELSCADCSNVRFCRQTVEGWTQLSTFTCPQDAPYCDPFTGSCRVEPSKLCYNTDDFICPDDGYFPDANNCNVFHVCNKYVSMKFQCPEGQNYDADEGACGYNVPCQTAECVGKTLVKSKLADSHYYAYCASGKPMYVLRCPGGYKLDEKEQICEATCQTTGMIQDLIDCSKYYRCSLRSDGTFKRQHLRCPPDQAFDASSQQCLPFHLTNCNNNNIGLKVKNRQIENNIYSVMHSTINFGQESTKEN